METKTQEIACQGQASVQNSVGARIKSRLIVSALSLAGGVLLALAAGTWQSAAVDCAGGVGPGGDFPASPLNDNTPSMGVFQISVNQNFWGLFEANGPLVAYPGWNDTTHTVTSPVLYDNNTQIGRSTGPLTRPINFSSPVAVGSGVYGDTVSGYPPFQPFTPFVTAASGTHEVLTEIQTFTLSLLATNCGCDNQLVPCPPSGYTANMVMAGQHNPNLTAGITLNKSVGLVQSQDNGSVGGETPGQAGYDFPASSFFDIFVEVDLPNAGPPNYANTVSTTAFPPGGAALYSDPSTPLIVQNVPPNSDANNPAVCSLPPAVVYIHGQNSFAPNLYFAQTGPINPSTTLPYFNAGDILGTVVLAGHGVLTPCDPPTPHEELLISSTLGTANVSKPWMPTGWLVPDARYPWANETYNSLPGYNLSGNASADAVTFTIGSSTLWLRGLVLSNLVNPITLPSPGNSAPYSNADTEASFEVSLDGTNYSLATGSGAMEIMVYNTNGMVGNVTPYNLQLLQLNLTMNAFFGNIYVELNSNVVSSGIHVVEPGQPAGFVTGGSLDPALSVSTDHENYFAAARTLHVQLENGPCGAAVEPLHITPNGTSAATLYWRNPSYTLQGSASLSPAVWVDIPGPSPINVSASGPYHYYQLSCAGE